MLTPNVANVYFSLGLNLTSWDVYQNAECIKLFKILDISIAVKWNKQYYLRNPRH